MHSLFEMQASDARAGTDVYSKKKSVTEVRAHDVLLVVWMWTRHRQFQQFVAHVPLERMVVSAWSVADAEQMCTVI